MPDADAGIANCKTGGIIVIDELKLGALQFLVIWTFPPQFKISIMIYPPSFAVGDSCANRYGDRRPWYWSSRLAKLETALRKMLSHASAAALSTVLRTTTLSYRNMRFSGTCPAETPQPIKMKFCTIDYVGALTRGAKNGWNRLAGGGPTDRWNITSKTFLTIPYFTLPYLTLP